MASTMPSTLMENDASFSAKQGDPTIFATRVSPRPFLTWIRVVVACAIMLPPIGLMEGPANMEPPSRFAATTWLVMTTATPNSSAPAYFDAEADWVCHEHNKHCILVQSTSMPYCFCANTDALRFTACCNRRSTARKPKRPNNVPQPGQILNHWGHFMVGETTRQFSTILGISPING